MCGRERLTLVFRQRHPYLVQKEHTEFVEKHGVVVTNYSPLANPGKYSDGPGRLLDNPVVVELGNTYSKTAAQILIRWGIDKGAVVIPKSVKESRIKENMDVFDFQLTADDVAAIDALDQGHRFLNFDFWDGIALFS